MFDFTPQQIADLNAFIEGSSTKVLTDGTLKLFYAVESKIRARLAQNALDADTKVARIQRKLDKYEAERDRLRMEGVYTDLNFDSVDIANAILYELQQVKTWKLSKAKVVYLLFEAYASWLAGKGERICIEPPVATAEGPWFWRVSNKIDIKVQRTRADVDKIYGVNSGLAAYLHNLVRKYYDYSDGQLKEYFCRQKFYKEATPEHNAGKWNKVLSDKSIVLWKKN